LSTFTPAARAATLRAVSCRPADIAYDGAIARLFALNPARGHGRGHGIAPAASVR
jgi:hypothetical protein